RVPGLPKDGSTAVLPDVVVESLRALDLAQNRCPRVFFENLSCEEDHELVAPDNFSACVDRTQSISIAIVCDTDSRARLFHPFDERLHIFDDCGIGMMVGKPPIHVAMERVRT